MPIKDYQIEIDTWIQQFSPAYWKPHEIITRLVEETGELAREINHLHGPKKKKDTEGTSSVADEMADIIFTLICLANSHNIDLDRAMEKMLKKVNIRDKDRFERK